MNKDYYREYYTLEREHWWFVVRLRIIRQILSIHLENKETLNILNIGAATGKTSEMLAAFGNVTSVEYDRDCCEFLNKELGVAAIQASVTALPYADQSFDLVCAFDVIEHVGDDSLAIREITRVCRTGGDIAITVPAFMGLWSHHDVVNQHYRRYTLPQLKALFSKPASLVYATYFNAVLFPAIYAFRFLSRIGPALVKRRGAGSDFTVLRSASFLNTLFYLVFETERHLLKWTRLPFGVSLFVLYRNRRTGS